jgi:tRNA(Leu) C34 or U34 (ribose-2'-O)-methylase TrmL
MIEIALYQPDIAQNAATTVRLAACLGLRVHIIEPAGFAWNSRDFRRAGMDYVDLADIVRQPDWHVFLQSVKDRRLVLATTSAGQTYADFRFRPMTSCCLAVSRPACPIRSGIRCLATSRCPCNRARARSTWRLLLQ